MCFSIVLWLPQEKHAGIQHNMNSWTAGTEIVDRYIELYLGNYIIHIIVLDARAQTHATLQELHKQSMDERFSIGLPVSVDMRQYD